MPIFGLLGAAGGTAGAAGTAAGMAAGAAQQGGRTQEQLQNGMDLAGGSPMQAAQQQQPSLFQNLVDAGQQQGPTRSGVSLDQATQAGVLGNQTDFNAKQPGMFGQLLQGAAGMAGPAGPGNKGVPQIDSTFMNTPMMMAAPQTDTAIARTQSPQDMLLALLQQQIQRG